jgi:hypothetical protein
VVLALTVGGGALAGWLRQDRVIGEIAVGLLVARRGPRRLAVARRAGDPGHRPSAARAAIATLERVDRGYCSGLVGWSAEDGDGEWVVTIRSAEIRDRTLRMFAGAGVVAGSDPEVELAETGAKLRTMLHALGTTDAL